MDTHEFAGRANRTYPFLLGLDPFRGPQSRRARASTGREELERATCGCPPALRMDRLPDSRDLVLTAFTSRSAGDVEELDRFSEHLERRLAIRAAPHPVP